MARRLSRCWTSERTLEDVALLGLSPRTRDLVVSYGELLSGHMVAATLDKRLHAPAVLAVRGRPRSSFKPLSRSFYCSCDDFSTGSSTFPCVVITVGKVLAKVRSRWLQLLDAFGDGSSFYHHATGRTDLVHGRRVASAATRGTDTSNVVMSSVPMRLAARTRQQKASI